MLQSHKKTIFEALGRHPIHPFPARMAPGIALDALRSCERSLRVLDPMAGSGTVVAVARATGHKAIGVDIDPLAVLLATVWTRTIEAQGVRKKAEEVLEKSKVLFRKVNVAEAYPTSADDETREFVRYWFDPYVRRQLTALSRTISQVRSADIRDALWCGLSRLIITKAAGASLAMDLSHSRPHRAFDVAPLKPFNRFLHAVENVVANCPQPGARVGPPASVMLGDARALSVQSGSIDLVLTSPPYLNAIDYMRCSKFSLVWMGYSTSELRQIRTESIGTEAASQLATQSDEIATVISEMRLDTSLSQRQRSLLSQYIFDMDRTMAETNRVLRGGGRAVFVVGDSTVRGQFISNSTVVKKLAERKGLTLRSRHLRSLPANRRYLPPPRKKAAIAQLDGRMRREVVMVFEK